MAIPRSESAGGGSSEVLTPRDFAQICNLTDVGAMTRLLHETIAQERAIELELDAKLAQRVDLEKKLVSLFKASEILEIVKADSDQMLSSVRGTCALAEHVSGKVRELDLAQSRVQETLNRIDVIVDRSSCIDGVKTALESEDYEAAAKYVETFLTLDKEFSAGTPVEVAQAETAKEQRRQLGKSKEALESVIRTRFAAAVDAGDQAGVERFAKLFAPLGLQEEGLRAYLAYLRRVVAARARDEYAALTEALEEGGSSADFVGALMALFRDVALAVEHNQELLRGMYGEDGIVAAIRELQHECAERGAAVLARYVEHRKLAKLARDVAAHKAAIGGPLAGEGPNPREVEVYLEEMLVISKRNEEYIHFMLAKMRDAEAFGAQVSPRAANLFKAGSLNRAVQEIASCYVLLEEFFMVENVRKAIRIDEAVPDSLTTSMVDDVFYILQNCARRAISTGNVQPVLAALNCVSNLLNNEYREALQWKLREPNLATKLFTVAGAVSAKTGSEVATALNNVDVSAEYVIKLRHDIEEHCGQVFPAPAEREKVKTCLGELGETSAAIKQMAAAGLEQLANSITPRLRTLLDAVGPVSYELTEAQYAENEVEDPWVRGLLHSVETSAEWLQPLLTSNNYDSLVHLIIDFTVKRLEVIMMQKRFNQLGGLQLDRDARTLVGHFSGMTQRTVRDKFARLTQMATILNLEKVTEILDYWGENSGPMTWRLTPAEVRRILGLRVDFKPEAIAVLKL